MPVTISFKNLSLPDSVEGFSRDIEAGCSALIVTSRDDECTVLTRLITGLSRPPDGSVQVNGQDVAALELPDLHALRQQIGVVPSNGGLVSNLKFWENITLPLLYDTGGITAEQEKTGLDYLALLEYSGNIMAMPAHLTLHERRMAALVRAFMRRPGIMLYSNCIEGSPSTYRTAFLRAAREFHSAEPGRTSLYLSTSPDLAADLHVDLVIRLNEPIATAARKI
jgi:phospholipid/cholesterol/gamma-HCH transport system ATP-binding protein